MASRSKTQHIHEDAATLDALIKAAGKGSVADVKQILSVDPDAAMRFTPTGQTALHAAAEHGRIGCVRLLLPLSDPNETTGMGWTPLFEAICNRHEAVARALAKKTNLAAITPMGETHLGFACSMGWMPAVQILLPLCDARQPDGKGRTPLMKSVEARNAAIFDFVIPASDVNAVDAAGSSVLTLAVRHGHSHAVKALLAQGARCEWITEGENLNVLALAIQLGVWDCAEVLSERAPNECLLAEAASEKAVENNSRIPRLMARAESISLSQVVKSAQPRPTAPDASNHQSIARRARSL